MGIPYAEVIGDPIDHSKSPRIHRFWLRKAGIEGDYRSCRITRDDLPSYFARRRADPDWRGCNVTMPLKYAVLDHVYFPHDPSFPAEPVNTVFRRDGSGRIEALNSDKSGFMEPLLALPGGRPIRPRGPAVIVGAGGAAVAAAWTMPVMGYAPVWIVARDPDKAAKMAQDFSAVGAVAAPFRDPLPEARLLVNASPLGMDGFPPFPFSLDRMAADAIVYDMVYSPPETALLREARRRRLSVVDGLAMLVAQAAIGFELFFQARPPRDFDHELREVLTR